MPTKIAVIGINHKRASIEIRERFSLTETEQKLLLSELKNRPDIIEAFVLSTCNRVEIYANLLNSCQDPFFLVQIICQIKKIAFTPQLHDYFYNHTDENAARHLLRVTAGLDSLILGEKQILGQVKMAVALAQEFALFQQPFNILSNIAIRAGKKAQTETDISWGGSSVGWAAVIRAEKILGSLENKTVLVIGAGKMSQLALQQMSSRKIRKLYLMNRTHEKAAPLAQTYNAQCVSLYDLKSVLIEVDLCVSAVAAPHHIIEKDLLESVMEARSQRPLMMIDIAVPRNVAPDAAQVKNLTLCTVDDLDEVIAQTVTKRQSAMLAVENIVENKLMEFYDKMQKIKNLDQTFNRLGT
ncbi:MAG: glutamyl-tRNA reductase [Candidatus Omnitrophica bacterium]|nr:glutamyl-tRNA reductase [Candidatus Omnitrophota bacterium]